MKERPTIFSAEMVRAILEDRKTQTRRVLNPQPFLNDSEGEKWWFLDRSRGGYGRTNSAWKDGDAPYWTFCPYGKIGDRLWVRETWLPVIDGSDYGKPGWHEWAPDPERPVPDDGYNAPEAILYRATDDVHGFKWRTPIFMPRWASRITLEITDVKVERVNEISEADANQEGCPLPARDQDWTQCRRWYRQLWDKINPSLERNWKANPWVWVVTFARAL